MDYALNGRGVGQANLNADEAADGTGGEISYRDLKSTVNSYFGAANRIASGEKFNVLAKRVTTAGKLQYLIEWEGPLT